MSKILIVGDIHFGVRNNSLSYLEFQKKWFNLDLHNTITNNDIKNVIFLGDVFDNRSSISLTIIQEARTIFKKLVTDFPDVSFRCILGNHDIANRNNKKVHSLGILEDQGVKIYECMEEIEIEGLKTLMLPWIVKDEMEEVQRTLVNNEYDLCFGHLEINDFEMVPGVTEDKGFRRDLFANVDKVFSGHFHLRRKHGNIRYVGTPYELTWSDHQDEKGVYLLDTETKNVEFIPSTIVPKHIKMDFESYRDVAPEEIEGNVLRIKFLRGCNEVDKINVIERINTLSPISVTVDDENDDTFDVDQDIEASIKDTEGFLDEYINIIETPEGIDKKIVREKLKELFTSCV